MVRRGETEHKQRRGAGAGRGPGLSSVSPPGSARGEPAGLASPYLHYFWLFYYALYDIFFY